MTMRSPAELFLGRQPRTHLDAMIPDVGQRVRDRQDAQETYYDRGAYERDLSIGDKVYVSAVDRLRGLESCRWVPGRVLCISGVKFTIELSDGRVIVRHADQVRRRYAGDAAPNVPDKVIPFSRAGPVTPPPVPAAGPVAPQPPPPVLAPVPPVALPAVAERTPVQQPAPDRRPEPIEEPAPAPPDRSDSPRYGLRNRATLRAPDFFVPG